MTEDSFKDYVLDQLRELPDVSCRAMFGGHGLYQGEQFFGIIYKGRLYFRTHDSTRASYVARGMKPFRPNDQQTLRNYYEVPEDLLDDVDTLASWARAAIFGDDSRPNFQ